MPISHSAVEYCNNYAWIASCEPPCILYADVSSCDRAFDGTVIVQVPLMFRKRIVERESRISVSPGHRLWDEWLYISCSDRLDEPVVLYRAYHGGLRYLGCNCFGLDLLVEFDVEPLVESVFSCNFSILWSCRDRRSE